MGGGQNSDYVGPPVVPFVSAYLPKRICCPTWGMACVAGAAASPAGRQGAAAGRAPAIWGMACVAGAAASPAW